MKPEMISTTEGQFLLQLNELKLVRLNDKITSRFLSLLNMERILTGKTNLWKPMFLHVLHSKSYKDAVVCLKESKACSGLNQL